MEQKGHIFGAGEKPVICVPVVESTGADIERTIRAMTNQGVPMIEWRMDWYEFVENTKEVVSLLGKLAPLLLHTVFLCTFRSEAQGGEGRLGHRQYLELIQRVAESRVADMVDLEFFGIQEREGAVCGAEDTVSVIAGLKQTGVKVVCSEHNFQRTPSLEEMKDKLTGMIQAGADFAKLAVMPECRQDVLHLMEAVLSVKDQYPDSHLIAMSMGGDGVVSRLLGGWYGSEVTFAAFGKASAPGQMDYVQVSELLDRMDAWSR